MEETVPDDRNDLAHRFYMHTVRKDCSTMKWLRSLALLLFGLTMAIPAIMIGQWEAVTGTITQGAVGLCYEKPPWEALACAVAFVAGLLAGGAL